MREILFRGKDSETGEWVFGWLMIGLSGRVYIVYAVDDVAIWKITPRPMFVEVDPATVGQYTGLTDKNGKRIFEGDILLEKDVAIWKDFTKDDGSRWSRMTNEREDKEYTVKFDEKTAQFTTSDGWLWSLAKRTASIGNIHDAPEGEKGETND